MINMLREGEYRREVNEVKGLRSDWGSVEKRGR